MSLNDPIEIERYAWPTADLNPIARMKALAAGLPHVAGDEAVFDVPFDRFWEFIVDFEEPSQEQRLALWKCHLPKNAPLADDVRLEELAGRFAIVGGLIRNAAVAAAFLAAAENSPISREHFISSVKREYQKCGKPYRELAGRR